MKQFYFFFLAVVLTISSFAQREGASKVYGYKQRVMPGMVRVDINGNEMKRQPQYNYFIYLASTTQVTPVEIWINGEAYSPITNKVLTTPVEYTNPTSGENKPKILVPQTDRFVLQLSTSLNKVKKPSKKGKTLSKNNELVIIYKGNGKLFYRAIADLSELDSVHMQ
jgi:hypothetical protein